ncbi:MAG: hypothetical protein EZS28_009960, partial [Streblomastix strix]
MTRLQMILGKQCRFQHYKYSLRFRHHYEAEIQQLMKKNHNERSKLKDHQDIKVQKFIIDTIWRCVDSRKKGEDFIFNSDNYIKIWALITQEEEKEIEVVMEEPLI